MKKNLIIICNVACLICFFIVLLGCDQPASEPATPKIVRKKIGKQPDKQDVAQKTQPPKASQPVPKSKPAVQPSDPAKQAPVVGVRATRVEGIRLQAPTNGVVGARG